MFASFRRLSKSAIGTGIMVLLLLMILVGFAMQDLSSVMSGGGLSQGTLVKVGDESVTDRELSNTMRRVLQQEQRQNPEATYQSIAGQFDGILDGLINERSLIAFATDHGFRVSKRLVDAEIANLPGARGLGGGKKSEGLVRI